MTTDFTMHMLIKYPLHSVVNCLCLSVVFPGHVLAMTPHRSNTTAPMTLVNAMSVNVSDPLPLERLSEDNGSRVADRIRTDLWMSLRGIQSEQQVVSIGGRILSMSSVQIDAIMTAISADETTAEEALIVLQQQLSSEVEDIEIEVSLLEPSTDNLSAASSSVNDLILSLNSAQLSVVIESPTFMALLRTLGAANKSSEGSLTEMNSSEGNAVNIPQLRLM